jgi:hypothetical protein
MPAGERLLARLALGAQDETGVEEIKERRRAQSALLRRLHPPAPVYVSDSTVAGATRSLSLSQSSHSQPLPLSLGASQTLPFPPAQARACVESSLPPRAARLRALREAAERERLHEHLVRQQEVEQHARAMAAVRRGPRAKLHHGRPRSSGSWALAGAGAGDEDEDEDEDGGGGL